MAFLQGKTPISFLQELCTKRGLTPQYHLIANEGAVHEPTFVFKVTAGEYIGTGKGPSKKKAKHNAALSVLTQILSMTNGQASIPEDYVTPASNPAPATTSGSPTTSEAAGPGPSAGGGGGAADMMIGNPVGELQELTQKHLWPPPIYEFTSEQGPPHAREFICTVRLWKLTEQGVGKSKKLAKRNAANAMLILLRQGMTVPQVDTEHPDEFDDENIPLPMEQTKQAYTALKEGKRVPTLTPQASQKVTQFYQTLKNAKGKNLLALQSKSLSGPSTNFCQMLQEIAEEQRFEVTYVDIHERSTIGDHQCLVQLSTMPVAVCHGTGPSTDDAHAQAARNALQYLKIMTMK